MNDDIKTNQSIQDNPSDLDQNSNQEVQVPNSQSLPQQPLNANVQPMDTSMEEVGSLKKDNINSTSQDQTSLTETQPVQDIQQEVQDDTKNPFLNADLEQNSENISPIIDSSLPGKKSSGKKVVPTILAVLFLVGGLGVGIFLVQQQQDIREKASELEVGQEDTRETTVSPQTQCLGELDEEGICIELEDLNALEDEAPVETNIDANIDESQWDETVPAESDMEEMSL